MHGWGRSGQHRNSGSQGGHGNAGWTRHKKSAVIRYGLQIGERGFASTNHKYTRHINISDLNQKLEQFLNNGFAKQTNGKTEINLGQAGYTKLLGDGETNKPLRVIVSQCSEKAAQKISQAGGEVITPSKPQEG